MDFIKNYLVEPTKNFCKHLCTPLLYVIPISYVAVNLAKYCYDIFMKKYGHTEITLESLSTLSSALFIPFYIFVFVPVTFLNYIISNYYIYIYVALVILRLLKYF